MNAFRLFLHVLAASIWVGGQLVLAGLVPTVRRFGEGPDQAPDVPALVELDREVRAAFATDPQGGAG